MKKILSLLSIVGLVTISTSNVVAVTKFETRKIEEFNISDKVSNDLSINAKKHLIIKVNQFIKEIHILVI